ncbi:InlB B-repeat-containing protein [Geomicrobium sp. JCM 19055]|uniref:InlB B-repeat-containing protein n=1 Tax=Geomicrobium sp. JCM 19055 TaxID=1460649 RepID=UPI001268C846|nr:right-handed parallel beta-helix repeat-containing protein [Geomicrobium sp. JCM 19055]
MLFANINTTTTITNCQCMMNVASNGGAIFANASTTPEIVDTVFTENIARANGGAVYLNNDSNSLLSRNTFERNEAINGAGVFVNNAATMNLDNTSFTNNVASNNAGALFMNTNTQSTITACTSRANVATVNGGAMYANIGATLQLENSLIDSNIAGNEAGGIYVNSTANATVSNAEMNGNEAAIGGAVSINTNGSMMITNSRIIDNNASVRAGAINNFGALTLINRVDFGPIGSNEAPIAPGIFNAGEMNVEDLTTDINGVYIVDAENVIRIINPLFAGSVFQLDTSEYVFPDPERSPIVIAIPTPEYPVLSQSDADAFLKPVTGFEDWEIQLLNNQVVLVFNPSPLQYTITYVGVLSTINPNPTSYRPEDLPIVLQDPNPVEGYEFIGWFDELGNQVTIIPQGTVGDIVLYARYRETGGASGDGQMITNHVRVRCCPCDAPAKE